MEIHWDSNSQSGSSFGSVGGSFPHTLLNSESMKYDSRAHFWLTPLQAFTLVTSPRLRLQQYFIQMPHAHCKIINLTKIIATLPWATTKAKGGYKVTGQEGSSKVTFHVHKSAKECKGMNPHTPKWTPCWELESQIFKAQFQGSKPIGLKSSLYHWKAIEAKMSKMGVRNSYTPSPLKYALTKKPGWKWNYYVVVV